MKKLTLTAAAILMSITLSSPQAFAADAGSEIKYRKAVMKSIGGHMGAIVSILKKGTKNTANLKVHTDGMVALSGIAGTLFSKGTDVGDTTILPLAWSKPTEFAAALKQFQDAAQNLSVAANSGDMKSFATSVGTLGKACKNCHENFREKKEKK